MQHIRLAILFLIIIVSCKSKDVGYGINMLSNTHYFDFQKDSMVFTVQGNFSTDIEVWVKKTNTENNFRFVKYHKIRNSALYDSFLIRPGENSADRFMRFPNGATLQLFNLYYLSDSNNRFLLSNGSNFIESAGFFTMKQSCPWPFFTGKYIQCQYEFNQNLNDSMSLVKTTKEWYAKDTGIVYFERSIDTLKFGKKYAGKFEKGIRQSF